jgi:predicted acylesterase/phospholipase RssA
MCCENVITCRLAVWRRRIPAVIVLACALLAGCGPLPRLNAVPSQDVSNVTVLGLSDLRYWGDEDSQDLIDEGKASYERELAAWRKAGNQGPLPPANYLAISGGGEDGAFGAGLLVGWTASGTRPQFKLVTGISTGALIAPFAFLGPRYDGQLRQVYTTISGKDVLEPRWITAALIEDALASNAPLRRTMARYVTQSMLDDIAAAYGQGRLLLIGTTDLDQGRPVIWNIGKIAASHRPGALKLVQDILIASAAIPGAFPPVMIDVQADGQTYQEMHVDGGASAQVFVYPPSLQLNAVAHNAGIVRERHLYVIRNARLDPKWAEIKRSTFSIAERAISSLIQTQGVGDLYRIYVAANRDKIDFNLASIPETFKTELPEAFDTNYMNELFELGYNLGAKGYPWAKFPPGYRELGAGPTLSTSAVPQARSLPAAGQTTRDLLSSRR